MSNFSIITLAFVACLLTPFSARAQKAYITNWGSDTVSVIDTATNTVVATINVGHQPFGAAVTSDGSKVYITSQGTNTVQVIDGTTYTVGPVINVGGCPTGIAVTPNGSKVYVTNQTDGTVSVISTASNTAKTVPLVSGPFDCNGISDFFPTFGLTGLTVGPDGTKVYVNGTCAFPNLSVIDTTTDAVSATIPLNVDDCKSVHGIAVSPDGNKVYISLGFGGGVFDITTNTVTAFNASYRNFGVAVSPDGSKLYTGHGFPAMSVIDTNTFAETLINLPFTGISSEVALTPDGKKLYIDDGDGNTVAVIDTTTLRLIGNPITVGTNPAAFGQFIQPPPPPTPAMLVNNLSSMISSFNLVNGAENSLDTKLQAAVAALNATKQNSVVTACNNMNAFFNQVAAQSGKELTTTQASELIAAGKQITAKLQCS
jgi:YVTN family beta-propeller protein